MKTQLYCLRMETQSETIPTVEGTIHVGTDQSIFLIELDHPRSREVLVQIAEEQG